MSEGEQGESQSLEDILSSIRKKISDDPDMTASAMQPSLMPDPAGVDALKDSPLAQADTASEDQGVLGPQPTASTNATTSPIAQATDNLSDILGRFDPKKPIDAPASSLAEDDLSDLLEDPLPSPLQRETGLDNASKSDFGLPLATKSETPGPGNGADKDDISGFNIDSIIPDASSKNSPAANEVPKPTDIIATEPDAPTPGTAPGTVPRTMAPLTSGFGLPSSSDAPGDEITIPMPDVAAPTGPEPDAPSAAVAKAAALGSMPKASKAAPLQSVSNPATPSQAGTPVAAKTEDPVLTTKRPTQTAVTAVVAEAAANGPGDSAQGTTTDDATHVSAKTLEETVTQLLRPMMHEWLEANLPRIVENALRIEVLETSKDTTTDAEG